MKTIIQCLSCGTPLHREAIYRRRGCCSKECKIAYRLQYVKNHIAASRELKRQQSLVYKWAKEYFPAYPGTFLHYPTLYARYISSTSDTISLLSFIKQLQHFLLKSQNEKILSV